MATLEPVTHPPRRRGLRGKTLLLALLGVLIVAVVPAVVFPTLIFPQEPPKLERLGQLPAFSLVDNEGQPFTEDAVRGHPTIVNFVFTRCDTICPVLSLKMQRLEEKTRDKRGAAIKFLSVSVDPAYDTPARLAAYAEKFRAHPARWRFVTGPKDKIHALVEGPFMTALEEAGTTKSGAPDIRHGGHFLLVDGNLEIRGVYDSNDTKRLDELLYAARYLARTQRSGYKFGGQ